MDIDLRRVIDQVSKDKGVSRDTVIDTLEKALVTAAHRKWGLEKEIEAHFNEDTGEIELYEFKTVVERVVDKSSQVSVEDAREHDPEAEIDDQIGLKLDTSGFGRNMC